MYIPSISHFLSSITLQQWFYVSIGFCIVIGSFFMEKSLKKTVLGLHFPHSYHAILIKIFGNLTKIVCFLFILLVLDEIEGIEVGTILRTIIFFGLGAGFIFNDLITDFASGFFILYYKPFKIGDWLTVGSSDNTKFIGKIIMIDLRYTTLSNLNDTILLPNSFVFKSPVCIAHDNPDQEKNSPPTSCKIR